MYDTINFRLTAADVDGVSFLDEIPCYLTDIATHQYQNGVSVSGSMGGLKVAVTNWQVTVKDRSICKWFKGDNYQSMSRDDVQRAIEKMSDELHLPMSRATVTRLDVAGNFIMQHPIDIYINHLGALSRAKRLPQPDGLYYTKTNENLCFYDKNKEQKRHGEQIPAIYKGCNVLRYEQRFLKRLPQMLKVPAVTGATLYEEAFYFLVVSRWEETYNKISKVNDIQLNNKAMRGLKEFDRLGRLALIERAGGELEFLELLTEQQKRGEITPKQAHDIRQAVKRLKNREGLTVKSDAIEELDKKVAEAADNCH